MGEKEEPMVSYYKDARHFTWLVNGWLYHGKPVVASEQVEDMNIRYSGKSGKGGRVRRRSRYRDVVKKVDAVKYVLMIGSEMQNYVDYSMPVRIMDYDALEYKEQIAVLHSRRVMEPCENGKTEKWMLSPLKKEDRLIPVITLVLYIGEKPWDASENLYGLLDLSCVPQELQQYISDYRIQVLDVCHTEDVRLLEFPTDIACMFLSLKYQNDFEKLKQIYEENHSFQNVEIDTYDTIWEVLDKAGGRMSAIKERAQNERGGINMCNVVDQMLETGRSEGIEIGKNEGRILGSIETYQEMNVGYDNTQFYIEMKYNLSSEKAAEYMKKFWKK